MSGITFGNSIDLVVMGLRVAAASCHIATLAQKNVLQVRDRVQLVARVVQLAATLGDAALTLTGIFLGKKINQTASNAAKIALKALSAAADITAQLAVEHPNPVDVVFSAIVHIGSIGSAINPAAFAAANTTGFHHLERLREVSRALESIGGVATVGKTIYDKRVTLLNAGTLIKDAATTLRNRLMIIFKSILPRSQISRSSVIVIPQLVAAAAAASLQPVAVAAAASSSQPAAAASSSASFLATEQVNNTFRTLVESQIEKIGGLKIIPLEIRPRNSLFSQYICPISGEPIVVPIRIQGSEIYYENRVISRWFRENPDRSPPGWLTGVNYARSVMEYNPLLQRQIYCACVEELVKIIQENYDLDERLMPLLADVAAMEKGLNELQIATMWEAYSFVDGLDAIPDDLSSADTIFQRYVCPLTEKPILHPVGPLGAEIYYERAALMDALASKYTPKGWPSHLPFDRSFCVFHRKIEAEIRQALACASLLKKYPGTNWHEVLNY